MRSVEGRAKLTRVIRALPQDCTSFVVAIEFHCYDTPQKAPIVLWHGRYLVYNIEVNSSLSDLRPRVTY